MRTEEFYPLREGERVRLEGGLLDGATADVWTELLETRGAQVVSSYRDGALTGVPALTVNRRGFGNGVVPRHPPGAGRHRDARAAPVHAGRGGRCRTSPGSRRCAATVRESSYLFVLNHTDGAVEVAATGSDLVSGQSCAGTVKVGPGGVAVVREEGG